MRDVNMTAAADDGLSLVGTLTLPAGPGPHPAVLLLHGSGRLDRDANAGRLRMELGPPLAAALANRGIATLRYDRRGVGATAGDWRATGFADNRRDAAAALRALAARPDIRADAIGVVGHSEGAVHAMSLGARPEVGAVVLLAGFARPGEDALRWQAGMIARDLPALVRPLLLPVLRALAARHLVRIRTTGADVTRVAGMPMNARWMRELLDHDPRPDLANIKVPVLAITGGKDIQVDPADLDEIRRLVPGEVEVHRIPDLTHVLRRDPGRPSVRSYPRLLRRPVDTDVLAQVVGWLAHRLRGAPQEMRATGVTNHPDGMLNP
ncbi:acyl-CoA thioester hydrolase [Microtetraspora sp. NBRC 13810]|uniref:alpha/beta hydrolase family protein n=1 Tax=Microtetraspora sp. NBRC 13810 TaxID=3030990 RepID=UPI002554F695|nr:alpha/beta fold hydrolase [Microtetraspora sp. NBRC 13810]GLW10167.1 acyl-CoA thioester hydrolase [Microtetraspora sp. NBRC 13810]